MMSPHSVARFLPPVRSIRPRRLRRGLADQGGRGDRRHGSRQGGRRRRRLTADAAEQLRRRSPRTRRGRPDDELGIPADMESVLSEAVESNLPRLWLSWHYRSQHESLIAFSNAAVLRGSARELPAPAGARAAISASAGGESTARSSAAATRDQPRRGRRDRRRDPRAARVTTRAPRSAWSRSTSSSATSSSTCSRSAADQRVAAALADEDRAAVRQEPRERPGRRARRDPVLARVLPAPGDGRAAAELRPADPGGRRAPAERRRHPGPRPGCALLLV